jgi:hypothetical protein
LVVTAGCQTAADVPADLNIILDASSVPRDDGFGVQNVQIEIEASGQGRYERYVTGGAIVGDENDMVVYEQEQVVDAGEFGLSGDELEQLWRAIEENGFFELTEDYRLSLGFSYAFIRVEAGGQAHQVFNIGMEVPEIRALVEAVAELLPEGAEIEYRDGVAPADL